MQGPQRLSSHVVTDLTSERVLELEHLSSMRSCAPFAQEIIGASRSRVKENLTERRETPAIPAPQARPRWPQRSSLSSSRVVCHTD
jgi:hypothetical protein